jgi:hypothetical protein
MPSRWWILPYRILNVKHEKKYFKARTNVHFLDLIMENLFKYKKHASSKLLLFDSIEISYSILLSKLFYEIAKFSNCYISDTRAEWIIRVYQF